MRGRESAGMSLVFFLFFLFQVSFSAALPPLPHEFYGMVVVDGDYASKGTLVEVIDPSGTVCGSFTLTEEGYYGTLSCRGDDPSTTVDEGASAGELLRFRVDGEEINSSVRWSSGSFSEVDLLTGTLEGLHLMRQPTRRNMDMRRRLDTLLILALMLVAFAGTLAYRMRQRVMRNG